MQDEGDDVSLEREEDDEASSSSSIGTSQSSMLADPREHSYLEESHPLLPDADRYRQTNKQTNHSITFKNQRYELAILELHGVVLFPDCTIPVKLQNRSMIRYIGRQIKLCRNDPVAQPRVMIGILPYESSPSISIERTLQSRFGIPNAHAHANQEFPNAQLRRRSWMRQRFSFGNGDIAPTASSRNLRQALMALRDEFGDSDSDDSSESNDSQDLELPFQSQPRSRIPPPRPSHPLVGRIGTIATVQHTHERSTRRRRRSNSNQQQMETEADSIWGNYEEAPELVFTAVGTSRFRILSCINDEQNIFEVEELFEPSLVKPPFASQQLPGCTALGDPIPSHNQRMAWNLSQLTPLPYSLYQHKMPWCLVEKIAKALKTNEWRGNLPSLGDESIVTNRSKLEPRAFSYWMANNAPFSESEKLKLLKMDSVLERLLFIWKAVQKLTTTQSEVCCGLCGSPLASVAQIFCVGGAEGTTSAYVNGHGFIHQITTLRDILEPNAVSFRESPSTENSYFPGYSWWITCCSFCGSMLGWKFQKVRSMKTGKHSDENEGDSSSKKSLIDKDTPERPPYFYGFMSSNVKVASRRVPTTNQ